MSNSAGEQYGATTMTDGADGTMPIPVEDAPVAVTENVPDLANITVARGAKVFVLAGLRLVPGGTDIARDATRTFAKELEECRGPGVVVLAGDTFDMVRERRPDPVAALNGHPRLAAALAAFLLAPERRVVVLPGTRDAALAHDERLQRVVRDAGYDLALACMLEIDTGS